MDSRSHCSLNKRPVNPKQYLVVPTNAYHRIRINKLSQFTHSLVDDDDDDD